MNPKSIIRLSNIIGIVSITLLILWVFILIVSEVFDFKVFQENLTETFYFSILAILALMAGALIVNIMFNLTRIAEKHNNDEVYADGAVTKNLGLILLVCFPVIFGLLYLGDYITAVQKEKLLISSAESVMDQNEKLTTGLTNYTFSKEWITNTSDILNVISSTDENLTDVKILVRDTIQQSPVFLEFNRYNNSNHRNTSASQKRNFVATTTKEERDYLNDVFDKGIKNIRYSSSDNTYELYYPLHKNGKTIVLHFSEYDEYGRIGS